MRALVTGGAGFIGSHLVKRLLREGWDVIVVDNLSSGQRRNIPDDATYRWVELTDPESMSLLPRDEVDAVFHLASHVGQELSFEQPLLDLKANSFSTLLLLKWCLERNVKKFIFASTMNVYGNPETLPVNEESTVRPPSPYSVGKIASEYLCQVYQSFGVQTTCLRLFNVYGPHQDMKNMKQGMVSIYMSYVATRVPILVRGSKDRFRDFVFVDDVVDAFYRSLDGRASGKIYNVSTGKRTYVWELISTIIEAFGYDLGEYPVVYGEGTPKDQFGIYGDSSRLQKELGWKPEVSLENGIRRMTDWVKSLDPSELPGVKG